MKILSSFSFLLGVSIYITYQIKKCVYIIKKACVCIYICVCVCVCGGCLDKYISLASQLSPPKQQFLAPPLIDATFSSQVQYLFFLTFFRCSPSFSFFLFLFFFSTSLSICLVGFLEIELRWSLLLVGRRWI